MGHCMNKDLALFLPWCIEKGKGAEARFLFPRHESGQQWNWKGFVYVQAVVTKTGILFRVEKGLTDLIRGWEIDYTYVK